MPKKGFSSITLPSDLYDRLKEASELYGTSISDIIRLMVNYHQNYHQGLLSRRSGVRIPPNPPSNLLCPRQRSFTKKDAFLNERETGTVRLGSVGTVRIQEFEEFCKVDLHLSKRTVERYRGCVARLFSECQSISTDSIRRFLAQIENPATYNNYVKAFRAYFRDFLGKPEIIKTFRTVKLNPPPPRAFETRELREFYSALDTERDRALFLLYATSGRRRTEVLDLKLSEVKLEERVVMPGNSSRIKSTWYSFFNLECQEALEEYLKVRQDPRRGGRLFPMAWAEKCSLFRLARKKTGIDITPQALRFWFANEMARLGVPDRFIDAFQGRIPRSVLARHYTDYSLENLKAIYDKAGLKVLG